MSEPQNNAVKLLPLEQFPSHTSGPWEIAAGSPYRIVRVVRSIRRADAVATHICDTANNKQTRTPEAEANARFIVRACNAHEELIAALKGLMRLFDRAYVAQPEDEEYRAACAAIAKAKGGAE
jgi:hypothetical protein